MKLVLIRVIKRKKSLYWKVKWLNYFGILFY